MFKTVWDWFILALVIYTAVEVPFDVAFLVPARKSEVSTSRFGSLKSLSPIAVANLLVDIFFIIDIPINFRSAVVVKDMDEVITDPKRIAILYLKSWFLVDFVAAIPFEFMVNPQHERVSMILTKRLLVSKETQCGAVLTGRVKLEIFLSYSNYSVKRL